MTLSWGAPLWLLLLPLLAAGALWARRGRTRGIPYPDADGIPYRPGGTTRLLVGAPGALRVLSLACLILALARPLTPGRVVEERSEGVPIVAAIDLSSSMLAEDFRPRNRLEVAKTTLASFARARSGDPLGVVAFAGEALTVVPVTTHQAVLQDAIRQLRVGLLGDGTAMGDGLAVAVNRLRAVPGDDRVIVLMGDGESNRGTTDPLEAAAAAAELGIRVFTIGVGSEGVARVPVGRGPEGLRYAELPVGLDEELMRAIASETGGEYFRATDPAALRQIYAHIDRLVRTPTERRRRATYREWYLVLLAAAGAALAAEWLVRGSRWGVVPG